ncbi:MAG: imidazole glycerol phosphate synthase subunit HisH [Chloroflexota bacterium]
MNGLSLEQKDAPEVILVDYGVGNLRSVEKALAAAGARVRLSGDAEVLRKAGKVLLPGVGAFGDGMRGLQERGLVDVLQELVRRGTPLLGICLGMQLLFAASEEAPGCPGLGLLPGEARRFTFDEDTGSPGAAGRLKVPQTGWNQILAVQENSSLLQGLPEGSYAYFNHSYYCDPGQAGDVLAHTDYGCLYASIVGRSNLYGVQFHPEKSQAVGLQILRNFVERC